MSHFFEAPFLAEQLEELASGSLPRRVDPAAHGLAGTPSLPETLTAEALDVYDFLDQQAVPRAGDIGLIVRQSLQVSGALRVTSSDGRSAIVGRASQESSVRPVLGDRTTVVLQLDRDERGWVFGPGGVIELHASGDQVRFRLLRARPALPEPELRAPDTLVAQAQAAGDNWLAERLTAALGSRSAWSQAVAAGEFYRLLQETKARKAEIVRALLEGREDPRTSLVATWARLLATTQTCWLGDQGVAQTRALWHAYEELHEADGFGNVSWLQELARACGERDELESVRVVLREARADEPLLAHLRPLDAEWSRFLASLARELRPAGDERLQRAGRIDPAAWWGTRR